MSRNVGITPPLPPSKRGHTPLPTFRDNPPTLDAYVTDSGVHACVWCSWCRRWHLHGHGGLDQPLGYGDGHRVGHCHDPWSPYEQTGYRIHEVGWWPDRPDWRELPVICRPCGEPFHRHHTAQRYCTPACRGGGVTTGDDHVVPDRPASLTFRDP